MHTRKTTTYYKKKKGTSSSTGGRRGGTRRRRLLTDGREEQRVILVRVLFHGRFVHFHLPFFLPSWWGGGERGVATNKRQDGGISTLQLPCMPANSFIKWRNVTVMVFVCVPGCLCVILHRVLAFHSYSAVVAIFWTTVQENKIVFFIFCTA